MDNGSQPATRQDLLDLEERLEKRFVEALRDTETKLLRAFHSFVEVNQKHLIDLDRSDSSIRERLAAFETRLYEIEKRLNMPGA